VALRPVALIYHRGFVDRPGRHRQRAATRLAPLMPPRALRIRGDPSPCIETME